MEQSGTMRVYRVDDKEKPMGSKLIHSKPFWAGLIGMGVTIVSAFHPELQDNLSHIAPTVVAIVGMMIGGFTVESVAASKDK